MLSALRQSAVARSVLVSAARCAGGRPPPIDESAVVERHVHGWGPGGQNVNKAHNAVFLKHVPTGVYVKVHDARSLAHNRRIAFDRLALKVDEHMRGEESYAAEAARDRRRKLLGRKRSRAARRDRLDQLRHMAMAQSDGESDDT